MLSLSIRGCGCLRHLWHLKCRHHSCTWEVLRKGPLPWISKEKNGCFNKTANTGRKLRWTKQKNKHKSTIYTVVGIYIYINYIRLYFQYMYFLLEMGNSKCYPRLPKVILQNRSFFCESTFLHSNRATYEYVPFGVGSSGSIRSSASSDSQMVNVNTLHPIHIITTPYSLEKMLENCQCFGQNPPFTHPFWSTI